MGLDNDAFRKFLEEKKPAAQKKQKQAKKKSAPTGKPGKKHGAAAEEDEGPKYRCDYNALIFMQQRILSGSFGY